MWERSFVCIHSILRSPPSIALITLQATPSAGLYAPQRQGLSPRKRTWAGAQYKCLQELSTEHFRHLGKQALCNNFKSHGSCGILTSQLPLVLSSSRVSAVFYARTRPGKWHRFQERHVPASPSAKKLQTPPLISHPGDPDTDPQPGQRKRLPGPTRIPTLLLQDYGANVCKATYSCNTWSVCEKL